jgi:hypothetical protein
MSMGRLLVRDMNNTFGNLALSLPIDVQQTVRRGNARNRLGEAPSFLRRKTKLAGDGFQASSKR